jgi:hypothetical protein
MKTEIHLFDIAFHASHKKTDVGNFHIALFDLIFRLLGATDIQYAYLLSHNPTIESSGMLELVQLFSSPDIYQSIEVMQCHKKQPE